jgi:GC-rich sequence DNA-binding factor
MAARAAGTTLRTPTATAAATPSHVVVDDDDEEERKWEEEQFRKGIGRRMDDASTQRSANGVPAAMQVQPQPFGYPVSSHYQPSLSSVVPAASVFASGTTEFLSIAQQADVANKALQDNI